MRLTRNLFRSSSKSIQFTNQHTNDRKLPNTASIIVSFDNLGSCDTLKRDDRLRPVWFWRSTRTDENDSWEPFSDIDNTIIEEASGRQQNDVETDEHLLDLKYFVGSRKNDEVNSNVQIKRLLVENSVRQGRFSFSTSALLDPFSTDDPMDEFHREYYEIFPFKDDDQLLELAAQGILIEGEKLNKNIQAKWIADKLRSLVEYMKNNSTARGRCVEPKKTIELLLHLYTRDSFLYRAVNQALREDDRTKFDSFGPFCYLMFYFCNPYGLPTEETILQPFYHDVIVYRGCNLTLTHIKKYKAALNTIRKWQSFTSTTKNRELAEIYGNTLFIINIRSCSRVADISHFSNFPEEEEILLPSGTQFRIEKFERNEDRKYLFHLSIS